MMQQQSHKQAPKVLLERERERERERGRNEMGKQLVWQLAELRQKEKMTHVETSEKAKKC
jgi:hypothetical protein